MKPLIGLYEEGTHNVVDIPECKGHKFTYLIVLPFLFPGFISIN